MGKIVNLEEARIRHIMKEAMDLYCDTVFEYAKSERSADQEALFKQRERGFFVLLVQARQTACMTEDKKRDKGTDG